MPIEKQMTDAEIVLLDGDEWVKAVLAKRAAEMVRVPVVGGLCELEFVPGGNCGRDPDCHPGISFALITNRMRAPIAMADGTFQIGRGVFSRSSALALREMIDRFLKEHPPVIGFGER